MQKRRYLLIKGTVDDDDQNSWMANKYIARELQDSECSLSI